MRGGFWLFGLSVVFFAVFCGIGCGCKKQAKSSEGNPASASTRQSATLTDFDRLQGTWIASTVESQGKATQVAQGIDSLAFTFRLSELTFDVRKMQFRLHEFSEPKQIDLVDGKEITMGIYDLHGDILKICLNFNPAESARPTVFATTPGDGGRVCFTLNRIDPVRLSELQRAASDRDRLKPINRFTSASNLRQIGQSILLYCDGHDGSYPPDLGTLIMTEDVTASVFVAPPGHQPPTNMTPDQAANWVNQHSDYVYIGAKLHQGADPSTIVCYEQDFGQSDGINILFADGHVRILPLPEARLAIRRGNSNGDPPK